MAEAGLAVAGDEDVVGTIFALAAEACDDWTPLVFDRFFERAPEAEAMCHLNELDPQARGRMLAEVVTLVWDNARGERYVPATMRTHVADHVSYGVAGPALYAAFMAAMADVLRDLVGARWDTAMEGAWQRQQAALLAPTGG